MNNPMRLNGFEFVEFSSLQSGILEPVFGDARKAQLLKHRLQDA